MLTALDELDPVNRRAWAVSRHVLTRFNHDMGCAVIAVEASLAGQDPEDRLDTLERLSLIYNALHPPTATAEDADVA